MLNNEFPPLGGGTATVNEALFHRFANNSDLEIDLVTSALGREEEQEQFSNNITIYKVPVDNQCIHHSSNKELLRYARRAYPKALKLHRQRPYDLCFAWCSVPAGAVALALKWRTKLPYFVRVSGPDIPGFEQRYQWLYPLLSPIIKATWRGAACVVAKCDAEAKLVTKVDNKTRPVVVPNGVDTELFHPVEVPTSDSTETRLICVGRLIARKGQDQLLRALDALTKEGHQISLDLVGTGDEDQAYRKLAQELGIEQRIAFSGYVPREQILKHYQDADIFVLPSFNEGMSVATLEALAAGLPLVVTRAPGSEELVVDGTNGFTFDWNDETQLVNHLRTLVSDTKRCTQMGHASREHAKQFSWDEVAKRYTEEFIASVSP